MKTLLVLAALITVAAVTAHSWLPIAAPATVAAYCERHPTHEVCK